MVDPREQPRPAAAVLLLRHGRSPYEVYLVERARTLAFLGGFHSFPGGGVDAVDRSTPVRHSAPRLSAAVSASARELFEELGVLIGLPATPVRAPSHAREDERHAVLKSSAAWAEVVHTRGGELDGTAFTPMGEWLTPPFSNVKFHAHYFAAWLPEGEEPQVWPGELASGLWVTPDEALALHREGKAYLSYPVIETLRVCARHGADLAAASAELCARGADAYPQAGGEIVHGVHVVPGRTMTLPPATHTNCYVLGDGELVVVDAATHEHDEQDRLIGYLRHLQGRGARLREQWLTHHHHDHFAAAERLRAELGLPIAAHLETARRLSPELRVDRLIEDGETTVLGATRWRALHTPGHAPGHLAFYDERMGSLIAGDLVATTGTILIMPGDGDMTAYLGSLERIRGLRLGILFPSHGAPIATGAEKLAEYIEHRLARERQIVAALATPRTPAELVPIVYEGTPQEAWPLAELSVRAHLEKLEREGRVHRDEDRFTLLA